MQVPMLRLEPRTETGALHALYQTRLAQQRFRGGGNDCKQVVTFALSKHDSKVEKACRASSDGMVSGKDCSLLHNDAVASLWLFRVNCDCMTSALVRATVDAALAATLYKGRFQ